MTEADLVVLAVAAATVVLYVGGALHYLQGYRAATA